ncbi:hypothetical protein [Erwinia persicina]|uniref:hypothetical protein n=1 Tax=Erwinia persicina TaxID=55211 RepID=UPI001FCEDA30|nr:hypothetical protein [Erwinia persicina]
MVRAIDIITRQPIEEQASMPHNPSNGDGDGGGGHMLEARVAKLESDVSYIRRDVDELKADVKSIDRNMILVLEKLESIKESLTKKPSTDTVDRKISDAKLAVLLGIPAIMAIGTAAYKLIMHFFFT